MMELSEKECQKIVKKATGKENVKVVKFNIESYGNYLGFLGEYFHLKIDANVNEKIREFMFFMKNLPIKDLKQRKMLVETGIFRKEVKLYENLLPTLSQLSLRANGKSWCPSVYLTRDDLLVLENLALNGYKILPIQEDFKQTHVEVLLESLASFHCSSIAYEQILLGGEETIGDVYEKTLFETSVADISWYHAGLKVTFVFMTYTNISKFLCSSNRQYLTSLWSEHVMENRITN